jgi:hypothetical protein
MDLPLYAVQRCGSGRWLVRAPSADPFRPAVIAIAAVKEPDYAGAKWQATNTVIAMRPFPPPHGAKTRADFGDVESKP